MNIEFLSRCRARVSGIITRSEQELQNNAKIIDEKLIALARAIKITAIPSGGSTCCGEGGGLSSDSGMIGISDIPIDGPYFQSIAARGGSEWRRRSGRTGPGCG
jgi:hypothetical protein